MKINIYMLKNKGVLAYYYKYNILWLCLNKIKLYYFSTLVVDVFLK